jgi:hypothetical protein
MHWIFRRDSFLAMEGWLSSTAIHLAFLLACALVLMPRAGNLSQLVVTASVAPPEQELVSVDIALPEFQPEADAGLPPASLADAGALTIESPWSVASGRGGRGHGLDASGMSGDGGQPGSASFFGTEAYGNRFVYVLDVSGSMMARSGKRLERAVVELLRSIDSLYDDHEFYVIVFGYTTRLMFDERGLFPAPVAASLENKQRLRDWLAELSTLEGTDPRDALHIGLTMRPHALFFLSDGEFNGRERTSMFGKSRTSVDDIVSSAMPEDGRIPVHTIAFEDRTSERAMRKIAEATGGIHQFVTAPDGSTARGRAAGSGTLHKMVAGFRFRGEGP